MSAGEFDSVVSALARLEGGLTGLMGLFTTAYTPVQADILLLIFQA